MRYMRLMIVRWRATTVPAAFPNMIHRLFEGVEELKKRQFRRGMSAFR